MPRQHIKKQRHHFAGKGPCSQSCGFSSSHVWIWELDRKKGWAPKNCGFRIVVLEKILESLSRRSNQSILKEVNPEYSLEELILKLKLQYFGYLMRRASSLEKTDAGKEWRQKEKRVAKDKMVRQHHWLNGHECEQTLGDSEGQGSIECCSPWGRKELDVT